MWDSWPIAMSGYPGGLEWEARLGARSTVRPTFPLETLPPTPSVPEPDSPPPESSPRRERTRPRNTQAVCGFRYSASNATPFRQTIQLIVAIFRARVRRAISGLIPLATRAW